MRLFRDTRHGRDYARRRGSFGSADVWLKIGLLLCAFLAMMTAGLAVNWLQTSMARFQDRRVLRAVHEEAIAVVAMSIGFLNIAILTGYAFVQIPIILLLMVRGSTRATEGFKWIVLRRSLDGVEKRRAARRQIDSNEQKLHRVLLWLRAIVGLIAFAFACVIVMITDARSEEAANALLRLQLYMLPATLMFFNVPVFILRLLSTAEDEESRTASLIDAIGDLALIVLPSLLVVYTLHQGTSQTSVSVAGFEITFNYLVALAAFLAFLVLGVLPYAIGSIRTGRLRRRLLLDQRRAAASAFGALTSRSPDAADAEPSSGELSDALRSINRSIRRLLSQHPQLRMLDRYRTGRVETEAGGHPPMVIFIWVKEILEKRDIRVSAYLTLMEIEGVLAVARDLVVQPNLADGGRHEANRLALTMMHKQIEIDRLMQRPDRRPMLIVACATAGTSLWSFGVHEAAKIAWKSILKFTAG